jgi:hypothetical protein
VTQHAALPAIPSIPAGERTPTTLAFDALCRLQQRQLVGQQEQIAGLKEQVQVLRDEVARLKGQKGKPNIGPSKLERKKNKRKGKRPGSAKRNKLQELEIHETLTVAPENIPDGSRFKVSLRQGCAGAPRPPPGSRI